MARVSPHPIARKKKGNSEEEILVLKFGPHVILDPHVIEVSVNIEVKKVITASNGCWSKRDVNLLFCPDRT